MEDEQGKEKEVEVVVTNAIALDPAKKYLIVMDSAAVSGQQAQRVLDHMRDKGITASMALMVDGDAFTSVQVIEVN